MSPRSQPTIERAHYCRADATKLITDTILSSFTASRYILVLMFGMDGVMLEAMNRFVSLSIVSLFAAAAFGGCTSEPDAQQSAPTSRTAVAAPSVTSGEVVPLDLTFTDPQLLDAITIVGFVPFFDVAPAAKVSVDLDGGTVSLVHVQATTGGEYYSPIQETQFRIACDEKLGTPQTSPFADDMTAAGFVPFPDDGIGAGESGDYWIAFLVGGDPDPTNCTLTYTRTAAKDSDTGDDIPVFTTTVQLN